MYLPVSKNWITTYNHLTYRPRTKFNFHRARNVFILDGSWINFLVKSSNTLFNFTISLPAPLTFCRIICASLPLWIQFLILRQRVTTWIVSMLVERIDPRNLLSKLSVIKKNVSSKPCFVWRWCRMNEDDERCNSFTMNSSISNIGVVPRSFKICLWKLYANGAAKFYSWMMEIQLI